MRIIIEIADSGKATLQIGEAEPIEALDVRSSITRPIEDDENPATDPDGFVIHRQSDRGEFSISGRLKFAP
jgi:hypothetical protein